MSVDSPRPVSRVLIVHQNAIIGGAEHSIELWATHMPDRFTPIVLLGENGPLAERLRSAGVETHILEFPPLRPALAPHILATVARLLRFARHHHAALIHSNTPRTNLYAGWAGQIARVPVVWHARNLIYGGMRDLDRAFSFLPTRIVAISKAVERRFHRNGHCPSKVETVLHGIDTDRFSTAVSGDAFRRSLGLIDGEFAVGLVGRIGMGKGHDIFLRAARAFFDRGGHGRFLVIGGGQRPEEKRLEAELKAEAGRLKLDERLIFAGFRSNMPEVMAGLDVVALCTEAEPLGRVVLEGMASGRPVVATDSGGVPELIEHAQSGWLVPPADPEALAAALLHLEQHPDVRRALGETARDRAVRCFSLPRHLDHMARIYNDIIGT